MDALSQLRYRPMCYEMFPLVLGMLSLYAVTGVPTSASCDDSTQVPFPGFTLVAHRRVRSIGIASHHPATLCQFEVDLLLLLVALYFVATIIPRTFAICKVLFQPG